MRTGPVHLSRVRLRGQHWFALRSDRACRLVAVCSIAQDAGDADAALEDATLCLVGGLGDDFHRADSIPHDRRQ